MGFRNFVKAVILSVLVPTSAFAALTDHCDWPTSSDVFTERSTGYVVTSADWNLTQCVLDQIQNELGLTSSHNYVKLNASNSYTGQQTYGSTAIFNNFVNFNDVVTFADLNSCDLAVSAAGEVICSSSGGSIPSELSITYDSGANKIVFNNTVSAGVHEFSDQVNVATNGTTGNRITVFSNTITSGNTACSARGQANALTIIDSDATATNTWDICSGTSILYRIPSTTTSNNFDAKVDLDEVFVGTAANQGIWRSIPRCDATTQKLVFTASGFVCATDSGGSGSVTGPGTTTNLSLALWNGTAGTALTDTGITVASDAMTFPDKQSSGGNYIALLDNGGSSTTDCATIGASGKLTITDKTNSATNDWVVCNGTSEFFNIPNAGTSVIADNQIFMGTGANAGSYITVPNCDDSTQKIDFNGTAFSCITDMGGSGGSGNVSGPGSSTNNGIATWNGTGGSLLNSTLITISSDSMTFPDKEGVTGGNFIGLLDNDNSGFSTTCSSAGSAGRFTLVDKDNTATDNWIFCNGTSEFFTVPNSGTSIIDDNKILVGTSAGVGSYASIPTNCEALTFNGTAFSCSASLAYTTINNNFSASQTVTNATPNSTPANITIAGSAPSLTLTYSAGSVSANVTMSNDSGVYNTRLKGPDSILFESDSGDASLKSHLLWGAGTLSVESLGTAITMSTTSFGTDSARWGTIYGEDISATGQIRLKQTQTRSTGTTGIISMPTKTRVELTAGTLAELRCITYNSTDSTDDGNIVILTYGTGNVTVKNNSGSCSGSNEPLRLIGGTDKFFSLEYETIMLMYEVDCGCWIQIGGNLLT